jgi:GT2 family glycosyltransferase
VRPADIVVVDQSQNDASQGVVEKRRGDGMPINYVRLTTRGLGISQNAAVARARYPMIAIIDDDCVADRRWLHVIEDTFTAAPNLAALTGRVLAQKVDGERRYPVSLRAGGVRADFCRPCSPWLVGSGNNFAVRREWFDRIGGCDERLGPGSPGQGGVDMDLFYRLLRAGASMRYEPAALVFHERQTREGRIARRRMYGRGIGACCVLWISQGELYALKVLFHWFLFRCRLLASAGLRARWESVIEECLILKGTVSGVVHAINVLNGSRGRGTSRAGEPFAH